MIFGNVKTLMPACMCIPCLVHQTRPGNAGARLIKILH